MVIAKTSTLQIWPLHWPSTHQSKVFPNRPPRPVGKGCLWSRNDDAAMVNARDRLLNTVQKCFKVRSWLTLKCSSSEEIASHELFRPVLPQVKKLMCTEEDIQAIPGSPQPNCSLKFDRKIKLYSCFEDVPAISNTAQTPFCSFEPQATIPSILKGSACRLMRCCFQPPAFQYPLANQLNQINPSCPMTR